MRAYEICGKDFFDKKRGKYVCIRLKGHIGKCRNQKFGVVEWKGYSFKSSLSK